MAKKHGSCISVDFLSFHFPFLPKKKIACSTIFFFDFPFKCKIHQEKFQNSENGNGNIWILEKWKWKDGKLFVWCNMIMLPNISLFFTSDAQWLCCRKSSAFFTCDATWLCCRKNSPFFHVRCNISRPSFKVLPKVLSVPKA